MTETPKPVERFDIQFLSNYNQFVVEIECKSIIIESDIESEWDNVANKSRQNNETNLLNRMICSEGTLIISN